VRHPADSPSPAGPARPAGPSGNPQGPELDAALRRLAQLPAGAEREALREQVIGALLPMARRIARRFCGRGESEEDLFQVACVGVVKAVDRYDPSLGHAFLSFAVPTVVGEVKCHFRDRTWDMRVPRPLQEAHQRVRQARNELEQVSPAGRPSIAQLASYTGLSEQDVIKALMAEAAYSARSLDAPVGDDSDLSLADTLGTDDRNMDLIIDCLALRALVPQLSDRERHILYLRFFRSMTQQQIAATVGLSQMHISRLLTGTYSRLRQQLLALT
jgi:RNA polymerase sigma-B factor